jgi:phosphoglycerate dehydrogenase-like enzyme
MTSRETNTLRVAVLDDYQQVAASCADWGRLRAEVVFFSDHLDDRDLLVDRLTGFDVVVAMRERTAFPRELLSAIPHLRLLITTGMRNAAIDMAAVRDLGIVVSGTGSPGWGTAELAFGLILTLARNLIEEVTDVRSGGWQRGVGRDLAGAILGVIGLGRLGSAVARFGLAFEMNVIAWSQNLTAERASEVGVRLVSKEELLAQSDFVSIHLRLSDRTRGMIGAAELALMKPSAYIVNTSRGPIINEDGLLAAIRQGKIAGAGLDVFEREPLPPEHPFRSEPRIIATPHIGYVTAETYRVFFSEAVENIEAWISGRPIRVLK